MTNFNQQRVLELHNRMRMNPETFSHRWGMNAGEIAAICGISRSSVSHWLGGRSSRRTPGGAHLRILAVADFLLTNAERIQPLLERWQQPEESER
jgi:transcriptional regulator with XRE-family HTH domain